MGFGWSTTTLSGPKRPQKGAASLAESFCQAGGFVETRTVLLLADVAAPVAHFISLEVGDFIETP